MNVKVTITLFIICLFFNYSNAQDTISVDYMKQYTRTFQIENNELRGEGGELFQNEFESSQFVLLGEYHGDARIAEFTKAILPDLASEGFNYFCLEVGPTSTKILENLVADGYVQPTLHNFMSEYHKKVEDIPFPFFEGVEDAAFLEVARDNGYQLFGIDQEYYSSTLLLIDYLLSLDDNLVTQKTYEDAAKYVIQQHKKDAKAKNHPLHENLLSSKELSNFFGSLNRNNEEIKEIISDLKKSWEIYSLYNKNRYENLKTRADYMKQQFVKSYKEASNTEKLPKILIKMGALHTQKGITSNGVYDIGNTVSELATFNGTKDLNIAFMFRYLEDDEEPSGFIDNSEGDSNWLKERRCIMQQGKKDKWVVVDLRPLKEDIINRKIVAYQAIVKMIFDVDLIVIPPMDKDITLNYNKK